MDLIPAPLRDALLARGYDSLTSVQEAVIDAAHRGRDLRISSQTGSGKTIALGLALHRDMDDRAGRDDALGTGAAARAEAPGCRPSALIVAPTRELAAQIKSELTWLYASADVRIVVVTGGTDVRGDHRALRGGADIVVGTPGRLVDHLERGAIDCSAVCTVVLDEADQMLDLGFREELEAIMQNVPAERRTHLVSATFSRDVIALAARYQRNPFAVEGTRLGAANVDIAHVVHVVASHERADALVNILLMAPDEPTLVFVRTRVDGADLATRLARLGFAAAALTGDMEQRERTETLDAFRAGTLRVVVATDVAARGIDVPTVTRVVHADPPGDPGAYTHRSGRTGRAGRKGTSIVLAPPAARGLVERMLRRLQLQATWSPAPNADVVARAIDERLVAALVATDAAPNAETRAPRPSPRIERLADLLLEKIEPRALVIRLLGMSQDGAQQAMPGGVCAPRTLTPIDPRPTYVSREYTQRPTFPQRGVGRPPFQSRKSAPALVPGDEARRTPYAQQGDASPEYAHREPGRRPHAPITRARPSHAAPPAFVSFHINWGEQQGADPRRLLALVCRRGRIRGNDVGTIEVGATESRFEVFEPIAGAFAVAVREPDARDPNVRIHAVQAAPALHATRAPHFAQGAHSGSSADFHSRRRDPAAFARALPLSGRARGQERSR